MSSFANASFPCGSLFGIPLRIHVLLPLYLVIHVVFDIARHWDDHIVRWLAFSLLLYGPILFITVLIHELGHCLACRQVGGKAHSILLWPLGGLAFIGHDAGPSHDIWVALAGPLTHIPMFIIWVIGMVISSVTHARNTWRITFSTSLNPEGDFSYAICLGAAWMNVLLFAFNLLLPAYPLDGGRIFCDAMLVSGVPPKVTAYVTIVVATVISIALMVVGWIYTYLALMLVALYMLASTYQLFKHVQAGHIAEHPLFKFSCEQQQRPDPYQVNSNQMYGGRT